MRILQASKDRAGALGVAAWGVRLSCLPMETEAQALIWQDSVLVYLIEPTRSTVQGLY